MTRNEIERELQARWQGLIATPEPQSPGLVRVRMRTRDEKLEVLAVVHDDGTAAVAVAFVGGVCSSGRCRNLTDALFGFDQEGPCG